MRIGVEINSRQFGSRETTDFVAHVSPQGSEIMVRLVYTADPSSDQDSGWIVLLPAEARQLGAALLAVAEGYTGGKQANFMSAAGVISSSVEEVKPLRSVPL